MALMLLETDLLNQMFGVDKEIVTGE